MSADTPNKPGDRHRPGRTFAAGWSVFVPTLVIGLLFGGTWLMLRLTGHGADTLARLLLAVLVFGMPVLITWAALRYRSLHVRVGRRAVVINRGWPHRRLQRLRIAGIERVLASSRPLATGCVTFHMRDGRRLRVCDIVDARAVGSTVDVMRRSRHGGSPQDPADR